MFLLYQHDHVDMFRFVLMGDLDGSSVDELQHAWTTASSVLDGKPLVVDVSMLVHVDDKGLALLKRMQRAGAKFGPASSPELLRGLGLASGDKRTDAGGGGLRGLAARIFPWCFPHT